jgi:predicted secreted protein
MRLNAATRATARLAVSLAATLLALVPHASAADRALINMLGYSEDGAYFAFEQFGIQDGSGFPFSEIFIVDLVNDIWVGGTPIDVVIDSEEATLADARNQAMDEAKPKLGEFKIGVPVQTLALIGEGEYAAETGLRLNWSTPACCGAGAAQADTQSLILATRGVTSNESYCDAELGPVGYVLSYQDQSGVRELHADGDVLPASRGCTLDYRLYAVVEPFSDYYADGFTSRRVAIIASYPFGFEGVDRRFLAVPIDR